jgi:hypothetical protein
MKPLQIGLLVAAGALGGALVMKWQSTRNPMPAPVVAASPAQMSAPAAAAEASPPAAEPVVPEPPAAAQRPSPAPEKNKTPQRKAAPKAKPVMTARNEPRPAAVTEPAPPPAVQAPAPEPAAATPAGPPVRTAPPIQEPAREPAPAPPPPEPNRVTLALGTMLPVRLMDGLSSERNLNGDTFSGTLDAPLVVDGFAIAERGARIEGKVVETVKAGKVSGVSSLSVVLTQITTSDGQRVRIQTQTFVKKGETSHGEDAAKVGAGAGIGAVIGAIAGGGRGAGIGAAVGGAAGAGDVVLTRGKPATLASETRINFRLSAPVTITERAR